MAPTRCRQPPEHHHHRSSEHDSAPHTQCLLYATYWVKPILSELLAAANEEVGPNKDRAPSGPVKVVVSPTAQQRVVAGLTLVTRASALIAWFPASWASKIALCFQQDTAGLYQNVQTVRIQSAVSLARA